MATRFLARVAGLCSATIMVASCSSLVTSAGSGLAGNLNSAILNQDDPEIVRDGAPAYLLMLDSFVEGSPENVAMLTAAADLYSAYGVIFVDEPDRARTLTTRGRSYGRRALCVEIPSACDIWDENYAAFIEGLGAVGASDVAVLYSFAMSWIAYIQANSEDWAALADLPKAQASLQRVRDLDSEYQASNAEHYLAVLHTIRPPALGGDFETGLSHYENALRLSGGKDLSIKVDFARFYARTLYDRELHDRLLNEVLEADAVHDGLTLFNTLAKRDAQSLLDSADDYF